MNKVSGGIWWLMKFGLKLATVVVGVIVVINGYVIFTTSNHVVSVEEVADFVDAQTPILVLGAGVVDNAVPSDILANRLNTAYSIYQANTNQPLIMSGDHRDEYYNEVAVMKNYLVDKGAPSQQIYLDHAGLSTYDSLYRLKHVVGSNRVVIVTQGYHLSRALMIAGQLGMDAVGVAADEVADTRLDREMREVLARVKDFGLVVGAMEADPIDGYGFKLSEDGNLTDEKENLTNINE